MPIDMLRVVMVVAGVLLAFAGLLLARSNRMSRLSNPTKVVIGFCAAILGYHLVVWGFPLSLTSVQFDRQFWWVVVGGAILAPVASLALDAHLNRVPPRNGSDSFR